MLYRLTATTSPDAMTEPPCNRQVLVLLISGSKVSKRLGYPTYCTSETNAGHDFKKEFEKVFKKFFFVSFMYIFLTQFLTFAKYF